MQNELLPIIVMGAVGVYVAKLWYDDFVSARNGSPNPRALPGAGMASVGSIAIAATGGIVLVVGETWGENALMIADQQSKITALFAVYTLIAAVVEEIIFRGYVVVENRSKSLLWISVLGASVLFAALHPFLWDWSGGWPWIDGKLTIHWTLKGWFSTSAVFVSSLWFYFVRFFPLNPKNSLLPCFAAHTAKNFGVIAIKLYLGYFAGWF